MMSASCGHWTPTGYCGATPTRLYRADQRLLDNGDNPTGVRLARRKVRQW